IFRLYIKQPSHNVKLTNKADLIVCQLLGFTHYHFLFATACLLRCHLSEALTRSALQSTARLFAVYIIKDRASQEAYFARRKPFDKLIRHARKPIKEKRLDKLPHAQIPSLIECMTSAARSQAMRT